MQKIHTTCAAAIAAATGIVLLAGCADRTKNTVLVGSVIAAQAPAQEVEVIYYLGVFDPREQIPPTVYRVRVQGQASLLSFMKFGTGWVRAELIDSLSSGGRFEGGSIRVDDANSLAAQKLETGRRLVLFGPEGFRKAPKDHRLVIVMGSNPDGFFRAMDQSVSVISDAALDKHNNELMTKLFESLVKARAESERLADLQKNVSSTFPAK